MDPKQIIPTRNLGDQGAEILEWETARAEREAARRAAIEARYTASAEFVDDMHSWIATVGSIPASLLGPLTDAFMQSDTFMCAIDDIDEGHRSVS